MNTCLDINSDTLTIPFWAHSVIKSIQNTTIIATWLQGQHERFKKNSFAKIKHDTSISHMLYSNP